MQFNSYQGSAAVTFKNHTALDARQARILNWALGLSGETGEVSELIKHHIFGGQALDKMSVAKEIGDALWYIAALALTLDIPLDAIAELNLAKLEHRHNGTYSIESSMARRTSEELFSSTAAYAAIEARILDGLAALGSTVEVD